MFVVNENVLRQDVERWILVNRRCNTFFNHAGLVAVLLQLNVVFAIIDEAEIEGRKPNFLAIDRDLGPGGSVTIVIFRSTSASERPASIGGEVGFSRLISPIRTINKTSPRFLASVIGPFRV